MAKTPKLRTVPEGNPNEKITLTIGGRQVREAYLTKKKVATGFDRGLKSRENDPVVWNSAAEIADSLGAPYEHYIDRLIERTRRTLDFPSVGEVSNKGAGLAYLKIQSIREFTPDDFDELGRLRPELKEKVMGLTLVGSVNQSRTRLLTDDCILPVDIVDLTKSSLQGGTTILMRKVGTLNYFDPKYVEFVLDQFCTIKKHVVYVLAHNNPVIHNALKKEVKDYFLEHPHWLNALALMGSKPECMRIKLKLGIKP